MAKGNFIEYVVSDDPNKYPKDGEYDGYYYILIAKLGLIVNNIPTDLIQ